MSKQQKRSSAIGYAALQFVYWMNGSVLIGFLLPYLRAAGYQEEQAGFFMAGASLLGFLLPVLLSWLLGEQLRNRLLRVTEGLVLLQLLLCLPLLTLRRDSLPGTLLYLLLIGLDLCLYPLYVSLFSALQERAFVLDFAKARAFGSLGYVLMSLLLGRLLSAFSPRLTVLLAAGLLLIQCLLLRSFQPFLLCPPVREAEKAESSDRAFVSRAAFVLLMLGIALVFSGDSAANSFRFTILESLGGDLNAFGTLTAFKGLMEIPVLFLYPYLRRFGSGRLLSASLFFFLVKLLLIRLSRHVGMLYLAFVFQMFSFGLYTPAIVDFISERVPSGRAIRAQSVGNGLNTLGAFSATILTGCLLSRTSVGHSLDVLLLLEGCGIALCLLAGLYSERFLSLSLEDRKRL